MIGVAVPRAHQMRQFVQFFPGPSGGQFTGGKRACRTHHAGEHVRRNGTQRSARRDTQPIGQLLHPRPQPRAIEMPIVACEQLVSAIAGQCNRDTFARHPGN